MFELIQAILTSLLLSAVPGFGVDASADAGEEPTNSEQGVELGVPVSHLASLRGSVQHGSDASDDHQPTALLSQVAFCEPTVWAEPAALLTVSFPQAVSFPTAGRSP